MSNWKVVSHKKLLSSKFFSVDQEELISTKGKQIYYDTVNRRPISVVAPMNENYELYMVKQYRHMLKTHALELVAGHLEEGETPLDAAKRELKEEAGLKAKHWEEMAAVRDSASVINSEVHLFLAREIEESESEPEAEEEGIEMVKIPLKKAVEKVISGEINTLATMYTVLLLDRFVGEGKL
jgi:ADP-ribose pyrophosphatase